MEKCWLCSFKVLGSHPRLLSVNSSATEYWPQVGGKEQTTLLHHHVPCYVFSVDITPLFSFSKYFKSIFFKQCVCCFFDFMPIDLFINVIYLIKQIYKIAYYLFQIIRRDPRIPHWGKIIFKGQENTFGSVYWNSPP